jgi:16S rRNA (cytidine1402-2'-O)-methyltransferase
MAGTLFVVATPIGNLEDVTARALRVLREVALIAAEDTRRTSHLLARYAITTPTTSFHEHNEAKKTPGLLARLERGEHIALVSDAGTPTISDPGHGLIAAAVDAGISVVPIPGPNAAVAALTASGFQASSFAFLGFPPIRSKDRSEWFDRARALGGVVVFYEAPHRIRRTLLDLQGVVGDCQIAVARELTKTHEEFVRGPISAVLDQQLNERGEFTVVADIGHTPDKTLVDRPDRETMLVEFGQLIDSTRLSPRQAARTLAERYRMRPNDVYQLVGEKPAKSVK